MPSFPKIKPLTLRASGSKRRVLLLLALLLVLGLPLWAQPENAVDPASSPTAPAASPTPDPVLPASDENPAGDEGDAPQAEQTPSPEPEPDAEPGIEDLFAPDRPIKATKEAIKTEPEAPKSNEPLLYIADSDNGRIVVMQGITGTGFTSVGLPGYGLGRFLRPAQVWVDYEGRLYVADSGNNRVVRIDQKNTPGWTEVSGLSGPQGVAVDGSGVYVADTKADRIVIYDAIVEGAKIRETLTHPQLKKPTGLWIDGEGAIYICCGEDPPGGRLMKTWMEKDRRRWTIFNGDGLTGSRFLPASVVTGKASLTLLDISDQRLVSMQDMTGRRLKEDKFRIDPRWRLSRPAGMAVDPEGRVYIADSGNDRILELDAKGNVTGEYYILEDDPGTLLANPTSIFIYSPAPPPPSEDEKDKKGKTKGKKRPVVKDVEFDNG